MGAGRLYLSEEKDQDGVKWESERVSLKDKPWRDEISLERHYRSYTEFHLKLGFKASIEFVEKTDACMDFWLWWEFKKSFIVFS